MNSGKTLLLLLRIIIIIIIIIIIPCNRNRVHVECKNKSDASNNRGNWNRFRNIQTIPEQHRGKARNQGAKKTAILGIAHILRRVLMYVEVQRLNVGNNITNSTDCNYRIAATLITVETSFFSGM